MDESIDAARPVWGPGGSVERHRFCSLRAIFGTLLGYGSVLRQHRGETVEGGSEEARKQRAAGETCARAKGGPDSVADSRDDTDKVKRENIAACLAGSRQVCFVPTSYLC